MTGGTRHRAWLLGGMVLVLGACGGNGRGWLPGWLGGEPAAEAPAGAAAGAAEASAPLPATDGRRDWAGPVSAAALDLTMTARDERGWRILWQLVGQPAPGPLPAGAMAAGVFLGPRPTGGFAVEITEVEPADQVLVVKYVETPPSPGAVRTQQVTAPYAIRLLRASERPVRFEGTRR